LQSREGEAFAKYLKGRGISPASVQQFELGCTPATDAGLFEHLVQSGVKAEAALRAGLCLRSEVDGGFSDRFRGRLMFPIRDGRGSLVGFGARTISGAEPKYLNSPETAAFSKSSILYGLNLAKGAISKTGEAILVEGYTDVIACFQAGVENVVATLGTALGEKHINTLARYARTVIAAYDSDSSGLQAMIRGAGLFESAKMVLRVARFPGGKDPDEVLRGEGKETFLAAIRNAVPATEFRLEMALRNYDVRNPEARTEAAAQVIAILCDVRYPEERTHYISECAEKMSGGHGRTAAEMYNALLAGVTRARRGGGLAQTEQQEGMKSTLGETLPRGVMEAERALLRVMLEQPETGRQLCGRLEPGNFHHPDHVRIVERVFLELSREETVRTAWLVEEDGRAASLLAEIALDGDGIHPACDQEVVERYVKTIEDFTKRRRWKTVQEETVGRLSEGKKLEDSGEEYTKSAHELIGGDPKGRPGGGFVNRYNDESGQR
jgi:DNA primase